MFCSKCGKENSDETKFCSTCGTNIEKLATLNHVEPIASGGTFTSENNDQLNISKAWKIKFNLLEKIGSGNKFIYKLLSSPEYMALNYKDKIKVSFNLLALLFGPLYYFWKKMWLKGAVILVAILAFSSLLMIIDMIFGISTQNAVYFPNLIISQIANYDYYRHIKHGEQMWPDMPKFLSRPISVIILVLAALMIVGSIAQFRDGAAVVINKGVNSNTPQTSNILQTKEVLKQISGIWTEDKVDFIELRLETNEPYVSMGKLMAPDFAIKMPVSNIEIDNNLGEVSFVAKGKLALMHMTIRMIPKDNGFTLLAKFKELRLAMNLGYVRDRL